MGAYIMRVNILVAALLAAAPASAQSPAPNASQRQIVGSEITETPALAPGDEVAIACDAIVRVADPSSVRVVLTIAAEPGDSQTGYKKVLALNEKLAGGAVHLKVPSAPDLENHTVNLNVYVVDDGHKNDCDAGQYRIVQTVPAVRKPG